MICLHCCHLHRYNTSRKYGSNSFHRHFKKVHTRKRPLAYLQKTLIYEVVIQIPLKYTLDILCHMELTNQTYQEISNPVLDLEFSECLSITNQLSGDLGEEVISTRGFIIKYKYIIK